MFKLSHINIAIKVLDNLETDNKEMISKGMFCFGSILPDLNAVFPPHRLSCTRKRFIRKLRAYLCGYSNRSLLLGLIIHYLCDYFCFTHNVKCAVNEHICYELNLQRQIITIFGNESDELKREIHEDLQSYWETAIVEAAKDVGINIKCSVKCDSYIQFLMKLLDLVHDKYLLKSSNIQGDCSNAYTYDSLSQMKIDLEYATFVSRMFIQLLNGALIVEY